MQTESQSRGSITQWIEDLRNKDPDAIQKIWNRFVERLVRVANQKLRHSHCRIADGEVVAADAFQDFFQRSPSEFGKLVDRNDLWQILVLITERRAIDAIRTESSQRRGGGKIIDELALVGNVEVRPAGLDSFIGQEKPPDIELMLIEAFEERLASLESDLMRKIAIDKMHGMNNIEIAKSHEISLRNVERKLGIIRKTWQGS